MLRNAHLLLATLTLAACASSVRVTPIKSTYGKPSNVAVYFRVETGSEPVGGLAADSFRIYEDEQLVSTFESKQTILNPEVAASHYTLLLVDMSGSISNSGAAAQLVEAATSFTERVSKSQKVGVYAFDGSPDLTPIAPFGSTEGAKAAISGLASYKPRDPSTNLNGAVIKGLAELDGALANAEHPMRIGTLVVFSDGTDRAHRVEEKDMREALKKSPYEVFAIGLGKELSESQLKTVGKDGTARAENKDEIVKAFDKIAQHIEAKTKSYYLLSYCSPARAGKHKVRIEAVIKPADGKGSEKTGSLVQEFDAGGFGPTCDPNTPPPFDIHKGDALAPKKEETKKDEKKDEKKKDEPKKKEDHKREDKKEDKREEKKEEKKLPPPKPAATTPPPPPAATTPPPPPPAPTAQPDPFQP